MRLGIFLRQQLTPFVLLFIKRDGSTYMVSMLNSHLNIEMEYEQFCVMRQEGCNASKQLEWLRDFYTPSLIGKSAALGFKTKLVDVLDLQGFTDLLQEKQVKIIHMRRLNCVKAVVSRMNLRRLCRRRLKPRCT